MRFYIVTLILFLLKIYSFPAFAESCISPNFDNCQLNNAEEQIYIDSDFINITNNSNMEIGYFTLSKSNTSMSLSGNSTLKLERIRTPIGVYTFDLSLDSSFLTIKNANNLDIETLSFNDSDKNNSSVINFAGFANIYIKSLETCIDCFSTIYLRNSVTLMSVENGSLNKLYLLDGVFSAQEGIVNISDIQNKEEKVWQQVTGDYSNLDNGGKLRLSKNSVLNLDNVNAKSAHIISGILNINNNYNFHQVNNLGTSGEVIVDELDFEKILHISETASGIVTLISLKSLELEGVMTIQTSGDIRYLNYKLDENQDPVYSPIGTLIYEGISIPKPSEEIEEGGELGREEEDIETLELGFTYLDSLVLNGGNIEINAKESFISSVSNPTRLGSLLIRSLDKMESDNVDIANLTLYASNYKVNSNFNVQDLSLQTSSDLILSQDSNLTFDTLSVTGFSKIEVIDASGNQGILNIDVKNGLTVYDSLLTLNNLSFIVLQESETKGELNLSIDYNITDSSQSSLNSGIFASGKIELDNINLNARINNTSMFNLKRNYSYILMHADNDIIIDNYTLSLADTNLPEWFAERFYIQAKDLGVDLMVDIERIKSYSELLAMSEYALDINSQEFAKAFDKMVDNFDFTLGLSNVIQSIDLQSDINSIGANISSFKPINNRVFINSIHSIATSSFDLLSKNSLPSYNSEDNYEFLWVRNAYKVGKTKKLEFDDSNSYDTYIAMAGFDIFDVENKFNLSIAGSLNVGNIDSSSGAYNIKSFGYNVGFYGKYFANKYYMNLSSIYLNEFYDTKRYSFNLQNVDSSVLLSEIYNNVEFGVDFKASIQQYPLLSIYSDYVILRPNIFYANALIFSNDYSEQGAFGLEMQSYSTIINEVGIGLGLYSDIKQDKKEDAWIKGNYLPYFEFKTFYKSYDIPSTEIGFVGMSDYYNINIQGSKLSGFVYKSGFGVDYVKDSNVLGLNYSFEASANNYSNHFLSFNYKFIFD